MDPARLRAERAKLLDDESLQGRAFGRALAALLDSALTTLATRFGESANVALVALGSYGRAELCPGSDVDVLLVHSGRGRRGTDDVRALAEQVWYPLWDAGFVTGHGARTVRESIALADDERAFQRGEREFLLASMDTAEALASELSTLIEFRNDAVTRLRKR